jgi:membrane associated rhomboid family serine protease
MTRTSASPALSSPAAPARDLTLSVALIGAVIALALCFLVIDRNWPKLLRVALSFATYATVLLGGARTLGSDEARPAPYWLFLVAGAAAGVMSGVVRPSIDPGVVVTGAIMLPLLFGSVHWAALRRLRTLRAHLLG